MFLTYNNNCKLDSRWPNTNSQEFPLAQQEFPGIPVDPTIIPMISRWSNRNAPTKPQCCKRL